MKKRISLILSGSLCISGVLSGISLPLNAYADSAIESASNSAGVNDNLTPDEVISHLTYSKEANHVEITGFDGEIQDISIPSEIEGLPVVAIADRAFTSKNIGRIVLPNTIKSIGYEAFFASSLNSVTLQDGLEDIGDFAFCWTGLKEIKIPDTVKTIGNGAFQMCTGLTNINLPKNLEVIGDSAFYNSAQLEGDIILPEGTKSVGTWAFFNTKISSLTIPKSTTDINGLSFLGSPAFNNLPQENGFKILNGIVLWYNDTKKDIAIPNSANRISSNSFMDNDIITSVIVPETVESIDKYAFVRCKELVSITIMNPNCKIGDDSCTICNTQKEENKVDIGAYNGVVKGYPNSTAQAYAEKYGYKFVPLVEEQPTKDKIGDANCDGQLDMSDVVLIMQALANPNKYGTSGTEKSHMTVQGAANADCDKRSEGLTTNDALAIQMYLLGKVETLPLK